MAVWRGEQDDHPVSPVLHVLRVAPPSQSFPSTSINVTCRFHWSSRPIAISEVHASISGERLICVASDTPIRCAGEGLRAALSETSRRVELRRTLYNCWQDTEL